MNKESFGTLDLSARSTNLNSLYYDIISMKLSHYKLLDFDLKDNHFEIFWYIVSGIWRAYWPSFKKEMGEREWGQARNQNMKSTKDSNNEWIKLVSKHEVKLEIHKVKN